MGIVRRELQALAGFVVYNVATRIAIHQLLGVYYSVMCSVYTCYCIMYMSMYIHVLVYTCIGYSVVQYMYMRTHTDLVE